MKGIALIIGFALVGALALNAEAQYGRQTGQGQTQTPHDASKSGQAQQQHQQEDAKVLASAFTARVTGQVSSVDQQSGKLTIDTPEGQMNVRFPSVALQNVKQGDQVTVVVGLIESDQPSAMPGQPRSDSESTPHKSPGSSSSSPATRGSK